ARPRGAVAGYPGPFGHGGAPGHGRTRPGHLPDRRGLLVRRRRPRAAPGGARALQPRAGRPDPARQRLIGGELRVEGKSYSDSDQEPAWPWPVLTEGRMLPPRLIRRLVLAPLVIVIAIGFIVLSPFLAL